MTAPYFAPLHAHDVEPGDVVSGGWVPVPVVAVAHSPLGVTIYLADGWSVTTAPCTTRLVRHPRVAVAPESASGSGAGPGW